MQEPYVLPNGLRRGARYDSIFFGAYAGPNATFDIRVRFDFKQKLNLKKMQAAADKALDAYPEFAVSPVISDGRIRYEKNTRPVRFVPDDGKRLYFGTDGEDGTNGYLFVFLYGERHLTLSLFHGLTDARGMIAYVVTTLWNYLLSAVPLMRNVRPSFFTDFGIRLNADAFYAMDDEERFDPLVKFAGPGTPLDLIDVDRLFRLPREQTDADNISCRLLNLEISNKEFHNKVKALGTSFAPYLAVLAAEAIASVYDVGDRLISVIATADGRRMFPTASVGNMAYNCPLPIETKDLSLPTEALCARLRSDMKRQLTKENAAATYSFILGQCDEIDAMGDIVSVNRALTGPGGLESLAANGTLFLTYPGKADDNPISRALLRGVTPGMLAMERAIVVYAHKDSLIIQFTQKSDDMTLMNAFSDVLKKHGFAPRFSDMGRVTQNVMELGRLRIVDAKGDAQ